jgi:hypothetical protein
LVGLAPAAIGALSIRYLRRTRGQPWFAAIALPWGRLPSTVLMLVPAALFFGLFDGWAILSLFLSRR